MGRVHEFFVGVGGVVADVVFRVLSKAANSPRFALGLVLAVLVVAGVSVGALTGGGGPGNSGSGSGRGSVAVSPSPRVGSPTRPASPTSPSVSPPVSSSPTRDPSAPARGGESPTPTPGSFEFAAFAFAREYTDTDRPENVWLDAVSKRSTSELADGFAYTRLSAVPDSPSVGVEVKRVSETSARVLVRLRSGFTLATTVVPGSCPTGLCVADVAPASGA